MVCGVGMGMGRRGEWSVEAEGEALRGGGRGMLYGDGKEKRMRRDMLVVWGSGGRTYGQ